jgi:tetratricopeptide (TPR) repeat protein
MQTSVSQAALNIRHPDLTQSKSAIKSRQKELLEKIKQVQASQSKSKLSQLVGQLGMFYQVHELNQAAEDSYKEALRLSPNNPKWLYLLSMLQKSNGDFTSAKRSLQQSLEYNDQYIPALINLANIFKQEGDFDAAKKYYNKALKVNPKAAAALVGIGQILAQSGEFHQAIDKYKKALNIQPYANQINFLLSQAYAATGDMQKAQDYDKSKGKVQVQVYDPLSLEMYRESRSASYYNERAVNLYLQKDYAFAEKIANQAINLDKSSLYPYLTLANIYVATDRLQQAIEVLEKQEKIHKNNDGLLYSLGVIEEINKNDNKAIFWYKKALSVNPQMAQASTTLASALMRMEEYTQALEKLKKAEQLSPENALLFYREASVDAYLGKCDTASKNIYQAVKKQPKNFAILSAFVKIAVHCKVSKEMLSDALNAARNMYQLSQNDIVIEVLAMIEAKMGNQQDAIDYQAQLMFNQLSKGNNNKVRMAQLKTNLELYKKGSYPQKVFTSGDVDLHPPRIQGIR